MNANPGDLVVCVDAKPDVLTTRPKALAQLREGAVYRIVGIYVHPVRSGFHLAEAHDPTGFSMHRFRKIRPDEQEPCEVEFVELLKLSKQRVSA